jgi:hypothetical protein
MLKGVFEDVQKRVMDGFEIAESTEKISTRICNLREHVDLEFGQVLNENAEYLTGYACSEMRKAMVDVQAMRVYRLDPGEYSDTDGENLENACDSRKRKAGVLECDRTFVFTQKDTGTACIDQYIDSAMELLDRDIKAKNDTSNQTGDNKHQSSHEPDSFDNQRAFDWEKDTIYDSKRRAGMMTMRLKGAGDSDDEEQTMNEIRGNIVLANKLVDCPMGIQASSLAFLLKEIGGPDIVLDIFQVSVELDPHVPHFLVLPVGGSHLCTCRFLQNKGLACVHFFAVMKISHSCCYHIGLINRRWYRKEKQDKISIQDEIMNRSFIRSSIFMPHSDDKSDDMMLWVYLAIFRDQVYVVDPPLSAEVLSRRFEQIDKYSRDLKRAAAGVNKKDFKNLTKDCQRVAARNHFNGEQGGNSKS